MHGKSGHHESGRLACGLSPVPRVRFWSPSAELAPYVSSYQLYVVDDDPQGHRGAFEPAWASLRISLETVDWQLTRGEGEALTPPRNALFGPTSKVIWSVSAQGVLISAGLRPRGWLRLFRDPAKDWADQIGQLPDLGKVAGDTVTDVFAGMQDDEDIPQRFEALLSEAMRKPTAYDDAAGKLEAALVDAANRTVADLANATGLTIRTVERVAARCFGFAPKLLLRRARFLRSLHAIRAASPGNRAKVIDPDYHDYSHFVRDAHDFLGMSPQAFLQHEMPLLAAALRERKRVVGAPAMALDSVPGAKDGGGEAA